jgi:predicted amidohydrolase
MTDARFTAALVQMRSGRSVEANIEAAAALIDEAAAAGAQYVQTPEMTSLLERDRKAVMEAVMLEDEDVALTVLRDRAKARKIWLHLGSLPIRVSEDRIANRSFVIDPEGEIVGRYDKIHMFDVDLPNGESWRESATYRPGETAVTVGLPWARLGLAICYDVRFPALHRALAEAGADVLTLPAAFTRQTGDAHWHVLVRARAIETGSFVLAAAQGGTHEDGRETFGHSLIVDPWGAILAEGGTEPEVIMAEIDVAKVKEARARIPVLENGRRFAVARADAPVHLKVAT